MSRRRRLVAERCTHVDEAERQQALGRREAELRAAKAALRGAQAARRREDNEGTGRDEGKAASSTSTDAAVVAAAEVHRGLVARVDAARRALVPAAWFGEDAGGTVPAGTRMYEIDLHLCQLDRVPRLPAAGACPWASGAEVGAEVEAEAEAEAERRGGAGAANARWSAVRVDLSVNHLGGLGDRLRPLATAGLRSLNLSSNFLTDLAGIENLPHLQTLSLADNAVTSLSAASLASCARLRTLDVTGNQLAQLGDLSSLVQLRTLLVGLNPLASLQGIGGLPRLATLKAPSCGLADVTPLGLAASATDVDLSHNAVAELDATVAALAALPVLTTLCLFGNPIEQDRSYVPPNSINTSSE